MVTHKYLVCDTVNEIQVACEPVNGHVLHICNGKQGLDCWWNMQDTMDFTFFSTLAIIIKDTLIN